MKFPSSSAKILNKHIQLISQDHFAFLRAAVIINLYSSDFNVHFGTASLVPAA